MIRNIILFAGMLAIVGCGKTPYSSSFDSFQNGEHSKVAVSSHDGGSEATVRSLGDNSKLTISEGTLPKDFPSYVKVYKDATNISSIVSNPDPNENSNQKIMMISFESNSSPDEIANFYKESLSPHGFEVEKNGNLDDSYITTMVNKDTQDALQIMAVKNKKPPLTNVQLIFGKK